MRKRLLLSVLVLWVVVSGTAKASTYGSGTYGSSTYDAAPTSVPSDSQPSAKQCTTTPPSGKAPWLYGAIANGSSVELYFTTADGPLDHYVIEYGTSSGKYQYAADPVGNAQSRIYRVTALSKNTQYYFRIRAGNGCGVGPWSNEIMAATKETNSQFISTMEIAPVPTPTNSPPLPTTSTKSNSTSVTTTPTPSPVEAGYTLQIDVKDNHNTPVNGAIVTLHSNPKTGTTDTNGKVRFENVDAGQHLVEIAYGNYQGEQSVYIGGDVKTIELKITVMEQKSTFSPVSTVIIGGLVVAVLLLIVFLIRLKRHG